jgi:hypothetical protein
MRTIIILLLAFFPLSGQAQINSGPDSNSSINLQRPIETVFLHVDKNTCLAGDTLWFKGYIFRNLLSASLSKTLYCEIYTDSGLLITQSKFPIFSGFAFGQLKVPDSIPTGTYWLQAFTAYQYNEDTPRLYTIPVKVVNLQSLRPLPDIQMTAGEWSGPAPSHSDNTPGIQFNQDTLNTDPMGYNSWTIRLPDTLRGNYSVSVMDGERVGAPLYNLPQAMDGWLQGRAPIMCAVKDIDSCYIEVKGKVTNERGKVLKNKELVLQFTKGSAQQLGTVLTDSAGQFAVQNIFFYDTTYLFFQLNKDGYNATNVHIAVSSFNLPPFQRPAYYRIVDTNRPRMLDTLLWKPFERPVMAFANAKELKQIVITGDSRKALDDRYAQGRFHKETPYSYDLRNVKLPYKEFTVMDYLDTKIPGWEHPAHDTDLSTYTVY